MGQPDDTCLYIQKVVAADTLSVSHPGEGQCRQDSSHARTDTARADCPGLHSCLLELQKPDRPCREQLSQAQFRLYAHGDRDVVAGSMAQPHGHRRLFPHFRLCLPHLCLRTRTALCFQLSLFLWQGNAMRTVRPGRPLLPSDVHPPLLRHPLFRPEHHLLRASANPFVHDERP